MENSDAVNIQNANNQQPIGGASDLHPEEAAVNSYFDKLFSGKLTAIELVHVIFHLKESPEEKDQSLFNCMVANLFEEYKFFPQYPPMQLSICADLFGLLIKYRILEGLNLSIALRGVLDALRKPAHTKMFVFGAKALEKFVDQLVEWPQYNRYVMQIPNLRAACPELAAIMEQCNLGRSSSSSHSEARV